MSGPFRSVDGDFDHSDTPIMHKATSDYNNVVGSPHPLEVAEKIERELAEAKRWEQTLKGWGGTPEHVERFIKSQQDRIREAQNIEGELAEAVRRRDEANESARMMQDRLNRLVDQSKQLDESNMLAATLCDMVLTENADDRSNDALIRGTRMLINERDEARAAIQAIKKHQTLIAGSYSVRSVIMQIIETYERKAAGLDA